MIDLCFYKTKNIKIKNKLFRVPYLSCLDWVLCYGTMCIFYELQIALINKKSDSKVKKLLKECIRDLWKATGIKRWVFLSTKIQIIKEFIKVNMPNDVLRWQDKYDYKKQDGVSMDNKDTYLLEIAHTLASVYHVNPIEILNMPFVAVNSLFSLIRRDRLIEEYVQLGINIQSVTDIPDYDAYKRTQKSEWERRRNYLKGLLTNNQIQVIDDPNLIRKELEILKSKAGYHA